MDRRTEKCDVIAVTLRLRVTARVNNKIMITCTGYRNILLVQDANKTELREAHLKEIEGLKEVHYGCEGVYYEHCKFSFLTLRIRKR